MSELSNGAFLHIEHFGSTAVPGLCAKPTIDIMVAMQDYNQFGSLGQKLVEVGYQEFPDNFAFRRFFGKEVQNNTPSFHLRIVNEREWTDKNERLFRDWLTAHPDDAKAYGTLKQNIAGTHRLDRLAYTEAKTAFCRDTVNRARTERGQPPKKTGRNINAKPASPCELQSTSVS